MLCNEDVGKDANASCDPTNASRIAKKICCRIPKDYSSMHAATSTSTLLLEHSSNVEATSEMLQAMINEGTTEMGTSTDNLKPMEAETAPVDKSVVGGLPAAKNDAAKLIEAATAKTSTTTSPAVQLIEPTELQLAWVKHLPPSPHSPSLF